MNSCLAFNKIVFNQNVIDFFDKNQDDIIKHWTIYPTLFDILKKFNIPHQYYMDNVATPVYQYFITIINGENEPGDCPVMRQVIDIFNEKGFKVEDVFLSCTAFKNVLNTKLYEAQIDQTMIINLMMILDANLNSIVAIYSEKLEEKDDLIQRHNDIIQNHMLLTITDAQGFITYSTEAFCNLCGYTQDELLGKTHHLLSDPEESNEFFENLWTTISSGDKWQGKIKNYSKNKVPFILDTAIIPVKNKAGDIVEYMAIRDNITDREVFQYDVLTKVFTRRIFDEKIEQLLNNSKNKKQTFSMILGDIDHFKKINDTYGHNKGDDILVGFAQVVKNNIRQNDMCFRWGGEEFVILLPNAKLDIAQKVAERIREDFTKSVFIENSRQSASFGVTEFQFKDTKESIFKRVDQALYRAKRNGRDQVQIH